MLWDFCSDFCGFCHSFWNQSRAIIGGQGFGHVYVAPLRRRQIVNMTWLLFLRIRDPSVEVLTCHDECASVICGRRSCPFGFWFMVYGFLTFGLFWYLVLVIYDVFYDGHILLCSYRCTVFVLFRCVVCFCPESLQVLFSPIIRVKESAAKG